jgi:PQQ-like domain
MASHRRSYPAHVICRGQFLVMVLIAWCPLPAQIVGPRPGDEIDAGTSLVMLPTPPRELRRDLKKGEEGLKKLEFAESIELLDRILQDAQQGDYFLSPTIAKGSLRSLRGEVERLLGEMTPAGKEMYELQVGANARKQLDEALRSGSVEGLGEVCRRYFHTKEGYRACYLLARYHLDRRQPTSAVMYLRRLQSADGGKEREPELSTLIAVAWWMAGKGELARSTLATASKQYPGSELRVAGELRPLPAADAPATEMNAWLNALARPLEGSASTTADWSTTDGDATRDRRSPGGMPLPRLEWWNPLPFQSDSSVIADTSMAFATGDIPAIPLPRPLVVGEWVVMPTPRMLLGIRLQGGARRWYYPSNAFQGESNLPHVGMRRNGTGVQIEQLLRQRVWDDGVPSHLSTDGRNVYCLRDVPAVREGQNFEPFFAGGMGEEGNAPRLQNRLVAVDVLGEGRTRWTVGKNDGSESRLSDAFFMGAPLPLGDSLYVIAEIKDEVRLVVLDAGTGKIRWSQQLLQLELPASISFSNVRRISACAPSYRDGVLVCPTAAGNVIAINPANRSLLWGFQYPSRESNPLQTNPMMTGTEVTPPIGNRWLEGNPILADGSVILTPMETDRLFCLDLLTGISKWNPVERGDGLYVAGVFRGVGAGEGTIVIVGQRTIRGIRVQDGEEAWPPIAIPDGQVPSGRGFMNGPFVYLPTSGSEILRVDTSRGSIAERMKTDVPLGNLCCAGNYMISQSAGEIRAYLLRESLRRELTEQVASSKDPVVLQDYANLLLGDGDAIQATEILRQAIALSTEEAVRQQSERMLLQTLLSLLQDDFVAHEGFIQEARALATAPADLRRLLQIVAEHRSKSGKAIEAMDALMELAQLPPSTAMDSNTEGTRTLVRIDGMRRGSAEVWLRTQFSALLRSVPDTEREKLFHRVSALQQEAFNEPGTAGILRFLEYFSEYPQGTAARLEGARRLLQQGNFLHAELWLTQIQSQGTPAEQLEATQLLLRSLAKSEPVASRNLLGRLKSQGTADEREKYLAEVEAIGQGLALQIQKRTEMPKGLVKSVPLPLRTGEITRDMSLEQIEAGDDQQSFHEGTFLTYDRESSSFFVCDSLGRVRQQLTIPLPSVWKNWIRFRRIEARVCGSLLVFAAGPTAFAVDISAEPSGGNDTVLWRYAIEESADNDSELGNLFGNPGPQENRNPFQRAFDNMQGLIIRGPIRVGPVSANGSCLLARGNLVCLDPLKGTVRWQRQRVGEIKHIFGDSEYVALVTRNSSQAELYRITDGSEVETKKIPLAEQHWTHRGTKILAWESNRFLGIGASKPRLYLWDTMAEKRVWELDCEPGTRGCLIDQDEIAILRPNGKLQIFPLLEGPAAPVLDTQLNLKSQPFSLQVIRGQDDYLVFANLENTARDGQLSRREIQVTGIHMGTGTARMTGVIASFDRATQKLRWDRPLDVRNYFLGAIHPPDSPVIVLYRQIQASHVRGPNEANPEPDRPLPPDLICEAVVIDRRDGGMIYQSTDLMPQSHGCPIRVVAHPDEQACDIIGTNQFGVRLNFTEDPPESRTVAELPTVEKRLADYRGHDLLENPPAPPKSPGPAEPPNPVVELPLNDAEESDAEESDAEVPDAELPEDAEIEDMEFPPADEEELEDSEDSLEEEDPENPF